MICTIAAQSQNHFSGSYYFDGSLGISDQHAVFPSLGIGYNINDCFSINGEYTYKMTSAPDKYRFFEHSLDLLVKYSVYQKNYLSLNLLAGVSQSINKYSELPRPSFAPKIYNVGYVAGVEFEYFINSNMALFSVINNRGYFLDKTHLELSYQIGIRFDISVFTKQIYHPKIQSQL